MRDLTLASRMQNRNKLLYNLMKSGMWFTLDEINAGTGYPTASASAGIRDFRKRDYGLNTVEKEYLGGGIYRYRLLLNSNNTLRDKYEEV
jgi:hypothetical protein